MNGFCKASCYSDTGDAFYSFFSAKTRVLADLPRFRLRVSAECRYGTVLYRPVPVHHTDHSTASSDADPWHFGMDPDPRIHASD